MKIEEMKKAKIERGYSNEQVAQLSGVPLSTVRKIFAGITKRPRYDTLRALEKIFQGDPDPNSGMPVKKQGEYTLEDYYAIPDDRRAELIDGVIYDMTAPTFIHQHLLFEIGFRLKEYIKRNRGNCIAGIAPTDVRLDLDNKTMVQPDVYVLCDRNKIDPRRLEGAPDFVVEILSPSTKRKDSLLKLRKYADAGVREYWLVNPDKKRVIVYIFDDDDICPAIYDFTDSVPVGIFDGNLRIDFAEISEEIKLAL